MLYCALQLHILGSTTTCQSPFLLYTPLSPSFPAIFLSWLQPSRARLQTGPFMRPKVCHCYIGLWLNFCNSQPGPNPRDNGMQRVAPLCSCEDSYHQPIALPFPSAIIHASAAPPCFSLPTNPPASFATHRQPVDSCQ